MTNEQLEAALRGTETRVTLARNVAERGQPAAFVAVLERHKRAVYIGYGSTIYDALTDVIEMAQLLYGEQKNEPE